MTGNMTVEQNDDWRIVKDPKKRKQIQDRLAQRARRKRLAQAKAASLRKEENEDNKAMGAIQPANTSRELVRSSKQPSAHLIFNLGFFGTFPVVVPTRILVDQHPVPAVIDSDKLPANCLSLPMALNFNGKLLGLLCGQVKRKRSQYTCSGIPKQLKPTDLQRAVIHPEWLDRFPFAHMRDAWIVSMDTLDEEAFLEDLLGTVSFAVKHGYHSYDPLGWVITKQFKEKWGDLFFPG